MISELEPKQRSFLTITEIVLTPSNLLLESTAEQKRTNTKCTILFRKVRIVALQKRTFKVYFKSVRLDSRQFRCFKSAKFNTKTKIDFEEIRFSGQHYVVLRNVLADTLVIQPFGGCQSKQIEF